MDISGWKMVSSNELFILKYSVGIQTLFLYSNRFFCHDSYTRGFLHGGEANMRI